MPQTGPVARFLFFDRICCFLAFESAEMGKSWPLTERERERVSHTLVLNVLCWKGAVHWATAWKSRLFQRPARVKQAFHRLPCCKSECLAFKEAIKLGTIEYRIRGSIEFSSPSSNTRKAAGIRGRFVSWSLKVQRLGRVSWPWEPECLTDIELLGDSAVLEDKLCKGWDLFERQFSEEPWLFECWRWLPLHCKAIGFLSPPLLVLLKRVLEIE